MKLVALVLCVCILQFASAQKDCHAAYLKSLADHDKFDIPARFVALSMEGESYDYETYQKHCESLMRDVHNVMDTVANELPDCPEKKQRLETTKFDTDFFCSFDAAFKDSKRISRIFWSKMSSKFPFPGFFKDRESYISSECMAEIDRQCSKNNLNYCR